MADSSTEAVRVRDAIAANIKRLRVIREMKGQDLVNRLSELGFSLPTSGLSEVETGKRRVSAEELLLFAVALNTSPIELLIPPDGAALRLSDEVTLAAPYYLKGWVAGDFPWSPEADRNEFIKAAGEVRRLERAIRDRPDMQAIDYLDTFAFEAVKSMGHIEKPEVFAGALRQALARVDSYVKLLADDVEARGGEHDGR